MDICNHIGPRLEGPFELRRYHKRHVLTLFVACLDCACVEAHAAGYTRTSTDCVTDQFGLLAAEL